MSRCCPATLPRPSPPLRPAGPPPPYRATKPPPVGACQAPGLYCCPHPTLAASLRLPNSTPVALLAGCFQGLSTSRCRSCRNADQRWCELCVALRLLLRTSIWRCTPLAAAPMSPLLFGADPTAP